MNITIKDNILNTFPTTYHETLDLSDDDYFDRFNPITPSATVPTAVAKPAVGAMNLNPGQRHKRSQSSSASPLTDSISGNNFTHDENLRAQKLKLKKEYRILHDLFYCQYLKDKLDNLKTDDNTNNQYEAFKQTLSTKLQQLYSEKEANNQRIRTECSKAIEARDQECETAERQNQYYKNITTFLQNSISDISTHNVGRFFQISERKRRLEEKRADSIPPVPEGVTDYTKNLTDIKNNITPILKKQIQADQLFLLQAGLAMLSSITTLCGIIVSWQHIVSPLAFLITGAILVTGLIVCSVVGSHYIKKPLRNLENTQQNRIKNLTNAIRAGKSRFTHSSPPPSPSSICSKLTNFNLSGFENFNDYLNHYFNLSFDDDYLEQTTAIIRTLLNENIDSLNLPGMLKHARTVILMHKILPIFTNQIHFLLHENASPLHTLCEKWKNWPVEFTNQYKRGITEHDYHSLINKLSEHAKDDQERASIKHLKTLFKSVIDFCKTYQMAVYELSHEEGELSMIAKEEDAQHQEDLLKRTGGLGLIFEANPTLRPGT